MAVRSKQFNQPGIYYCTITCYAWIALFELTQFYDFVYSWYNRLIRSQCQILGYVIMPNHLHMLMYHPGLGKDMNAIIGEGKRFMAYELIKRLKAAKREEILSQLANGVRAVDRRRGQLHRVFEASSDIKRCESERFIQQKLNYMHANPVRGKWRLAADYVSYPHSSAGFYEGLGSLIPVTHWREAGVFDPIGSMDTAGSSASDPAGTS